LFVKLEVKREYKLKTFFVMPFDFFLNELLVLLNFIQIKNLYDLYVLTIYTVKWGFSVINDPFQKNYFKQSFKALLRFLN
jgi:hypothetical protein